MQIYVKTLIGRTIVLDIDPCDTIENINNKINEKEGIPQHHQKLIYKGTVLTPERTLAYYNIQKNSTIFLILPLRG